MDGGASLRSRMPIPVPPPNPRVTLVALEMRPFHNLLSAIAVFASLGLMAGCASVQAPLPPSLELPKPPTDLRAVRKGDRVYLFWTPPIQTMDRQNVRRAGPTRVCRSLETSMNACGTSVGNVAPLEKAAGQGNAAPRREASFVDTLPADLQQQNPMRLATYAVEPMNLHARSAGLSNRVQVGLAPTLPPPANFRAELTGIGVVLTWDCETVPQTTPGANYLYRIYRNLSDSKAAVKMADVECPGGRFEDRTIEWQKNYEYRITVVTVAPIDSRDHRCPSATEDKEHATESKCADSSSGEGDDSPPQRVFTKDVYPPAVPSGLQAVYSGPGQQAFIDLLWSPVTDADLAGYNLYRRENGSPSVKINSDLVKTPAYRDATVASGKTYFYSVSAVDERGNESAHSEEARESVLP